MFNLISALGFLFQMNKLLKVLKWTFMSELCLCQTFFLICVLCFSYNSSFLLFKSTVSSVEQVVSALYHLPLPSQANIDSVSGCGPARLHSCQCLQPHVTTQNLNESVNVVSSLLGVST